MPNALTALESVANPSPGKAALRQLRNSVNVAEIREQVSLGGKTARKHLLQQSSCNDSQAQ